MITKIDSLIHIALKKTIAKNGIQISSNIVTSNHALKGQVCVHVDNWRARAYKALNKNSGKANKSGTNQQAFNRSKAKLLKEGIIAEGNSHFWEVV